MTEDWMTRGFEEAEKMVRNTVRRKRQRNFWTYPGERAKIRFLRSAKDSVNFKRCFVPWIQGNKFLTSPDVQPNPFIEAGRNLQPAFAWPIIDRRILEIEQEGEETKNIGPRILYFAEGPKTRRALIAFENEIRAQINEEREADGLEPFTEEQYNLTSFDLRVVKEKGAPWQFLPVKGGEPKELSDEDKKLIEENPINLEMELEPLPLEDIKQLLIRPTSESAEPAEPYSYEGDTKATDKKESEEEPTFFETGEGK